LVERPAGRVLEPFDLSRRMFAVDPGVSAPKLPAITATGTAATNGKPQVVTDATFASDVLGASASVPVLMDCWAPWCGPCRMIAPILDQLAAESGGRYKIVKLNVDENPATSARFQIRSIPTMLIFKSGQMVDQIVGAVPKQAIAARLQAQVS
jgi:thioredoxin